MMTTATNRPHRAPVDRWPHRCLIDGRWIGDGVDPVVDPSTGEEIARVPRCGRAEVNEAIGAAKAAFAAWSGLLTRERSAILRRWFDLAMGNSEELARLLTSEQGKPLTEARSEIAYAASFIEFYAEEAKRVYGETIPSHVRDGRIVVLRQPVGVVAAITPWNFPAAMVTRKLAPALAAGCTVVLKPAPETPLTALALAALAQEAGIPSPRSSDSKASRKSSNSQMPRVQDLQRISMPATWAASGALPRRWNMAWSRSTAGFCRPNWLPSAA
jgi:succinate-semialdehyde dehydrogenase / glutarate-semialdehyde dehydrogenase